MIIQINVYPSYLYLTHTFMNIYAKIHPLVFLMEKRELVDLL